MAADYACRTRDPKDPGEGFADAISPADLTLRWYKYLPVRYENLRAAKYVLENVWRIFRGVRQFNRGGWCYTGRPKTWYIRPDSCVPFPEHLVYAVYLNPNLRVYEARAEDRAPDDPMCPVDWKNRYEALIWKRTS
jgi:hypothetical protein